MRDTKHLRKEKHYEKENSNEEIKEQVQKGVREDEKEVRQKESLAEMSGTLSLCNLYSRKENAYEETICWSNYRIDICFNTGMEYGGVN